MSNAKAISKKLEQIERKQLKGARSIQRKFVQVLSDYLLSSLIFNNDGQIEDNASNLSIAASLNQLADTFRRQVVIPYILEIASLIFNDLHSTSAKSFKNKAGSDNVLSASNKAKQLLAIQYGYDNGRLIEGSPLSRDALSRVWSTVRAHVVNAVTGKITLKDLRKTLADYIEGGNGRGAIVREIESSLGDIAYQYERKQSQIIAQEIGYRFFIYQGGLIRDSRDFCIHRNDQVFSVEELYKFGTPDDAYGGYTNKSKGEFKGKTKPYNPATDLGGYNCRHRIDWISDELAFRLRPELRGTT